MKRSVLSVIILVMANWANAETHISGGNISGVWDLAGSPYFIEGNCVITLASTLEIEPGVEVFMEPLVRIRCEGQLLAVGTETDSIIITATDTTQGCEGLDFLNTDLSPMDSSKLVYCEISYGVGSPAPDPYMHGGGLYLNNSSRVLISHCLITRCRTGYVQGADGAPGSGMGGDGYPGSDAEAGAGGAIYCENSNVRIENCAITYNHTGDARGGDGGDGAGDESYVATAQGGDGGLGGTGYGGTGGAIYINSSSAIIENNVICHNYTGNGFGGTGGDGGFAISWEWYAYGGDGGFGGQGYGGKGGAIGSVESTSLLINNLIYYNTAGNGYGGQGGDGGGALGTYGGPGSSGDGGIGYGGDGYAVYAQASSYDIYENCTITQHVTLNMGEGGPGGTWPYTGTPGLGFRGTRIIYGDNLMITNSIVWNNADPAITSTAQVTYSCSEGGFPGAGNISGDPLFVSGTQGDYFLSQTAAGQPEQSPCVDAGNPASTMILGTTRTDGILDEGILDMGFHYNSYASASLLIVSPIQLSFCAFYGYSMPEDQILVVSSVGQPILSYTVSENTNWLTVLPMSGGPVPPSDTLVVSVDTTGLEEGIYQGEITITAVGAQGSPRVVPVTFTVTQSIAGSISGVLPQAVIQVIGDIYVDSDDFLEIEPGVTLLFNGPYSFDIYGYLHAVGTESDSIKFMANEGVEGWRGIRFWDSAADSCSLEYCLITNSDSSGIYCEDIDITVRNCVISDNDSYDGGGIYCYNVHALIDSCTILRNSAGRHGGGIYFKNSAGVISNCTISENTAESYGAGMCMKDSDSTIVSNCTISGNSESSGAGISLEDSDCTIEYCIISNNSADASGGGIQIWNNTHPIISYCSIVDNQAETGGGITTHQGAAPTITNCVISGNSASGGGGALSIQSTGAGLEVSYCYIGDNMANTIGGGIYLHGAYECEIHHNLICGNTAGEKGGGISVTLGLSQGVYNNTIQGNSAPNGGGIYLYNFGYMSMGTKSITGNIIEGNSGGGVYYGEEAENLIKYSNIFNNEGGNFVGLNVPVGLGELTNVNLNGDSCDFCNNIFVDPLFVDPFQGNFNLQNSSLCIDAGDPSCPNDPDGTIPDIGAFHFEQAMPSASVDLTPDESYPVIPASGGEFDFNIEITNNETTPVSFDAWIVAQLPNGAWFGPVLGPVNVTLPAGQMVDRNRTQSVPGGAPTGYYEYGARVGIHPDDIWHADSFTFVKWESGDGSPVDEWFNSGESFDQWLASISQPQIPDHFALYPAYPNPFNPAATIRYALPEPGIVNLNVYNISGRLVTSVINGWRNAGYHEVTFDGSDLASGVYIYRLTAEEYTATGKMLLVK